MRSRTAVAILTLLWALFFWRVLTPIDADKASFKQGDFSGQFVAFGAYQYERLTAGEIPLWNPYNNAGLPFVADTQAAAFYPPRLLTIALARLSGGWSYHALELEAIFHILGYTLAMYAFVQRLTQSEWGGLTAAIISGYSGYLSGYPPLQLALLESGVWLPLVLLALHVATNTDSIQPRLIVLAGFSLGLSWMAGHPQTSWFLTCLAVAYFAFRLWEQNTWTHWRFVGGITLLGVITLGTTAITFLPGVEYLAETARAGQGYAGKTNGFPLQDLIQFMYPGVVSLFSPLYVGAIGLLAAINAFRGQSRAIWFWGGTTIVGLLWSFGGNTALFDALYNILPGLRFFRGQERAAYLVANSLAILAGYGVATLDTSDWRNAATRATRWLTISASGVFGIVALLWLGFPNAYGGLVGPVTFTAIILLTAYLLLTYLDIAYLRPALLALLVFELFTVNMGAPSNYDDIPPADQISLAPTSLIQPVLSDDLPPVRVDGFRGLTDNYGSLYEVYDARGISPLFLDGPYQLQQPPFASPGNFETNPTFWELTAVGYVYSGFETLPVDSTVITTGVDRFGPVYLHELVAPRPFAHLIYRADIVDSDTFARALLADPAYQPHKSVILHEQPPFELPTTPPTTATATMTAFTPEMFTVEINTSENAILTLAHPHYRGWHATLNSEPVAIRRAYGGLSAIAVPAGDHTLTLSYTPLSFRVGAIFSLATWGVLGIIGIHALLMRKPTYAVNADEQPTH
jgi:hypothetical protein